MDEYDCGSHPCFWSPKWPLSYPVFQRRKNFKPPNDSPAVKHTKIIHIDTQTPHLLQKGKNGLVARAEEDTEEPMQDQTILKGHKTKT